MDREKSQIRVFLSAKYYVMEGFSFYTLERLKLGFELASFLSRMDNMELWF
jgi:hypothetical protein